MTTRQFDEDYLGEPAPYVAADEDDWQADRSAGSYVFLAGVILLWAAVIYVALRDVTG